MNYPRIHGTCKMWAQNSDIETRHKAGGSYGGQRYYAECSFKRKVVEGNSQGCKRWSPVEEKGANE